MSNSQNLQNLQNSQSSFDFAGSSNLAQIEIVTNASPNDFETMCKMPEFFNYCYETEKTFNPYQRVYKERTELFYPSAIPIAEEEHVNDYKDRYERLRTLEKFVPMYREGRGSLTAYGRTTVLESYAQQGNLMELRILNSIEPLEETMVMNLANRAAEKGQTHVLDWIYETFAILPDEDGMNSAYMYPEVYVWGEDHGILPDEQGANLVAATGNLNTLEWLWERGVRPTFEGANSVARKNDFVTLEWLANHGVLPNRLAANFAKLNGREELLQWLISRGVQPTARRLFSE